MFNNSMHKNYQYSSKDFRPFDWIADKKCTQEQLFSRALLYCTQYLLLSNSMFTGDNEFHKEYSTQVNLSGGREWHQPPYSLTLGLMHSLQPDQLDEHIILYHGVKNNQAYKEIFKSKLKPGPGQAYQGQRGINKKLVVPKGIYGSQHLAITLGYSDPSFPIIIQFAANDYVATSNKTYFVVQQAIPLKLVFPFKNSPDKRQAHYV